MDALRGIAMWLGVVLHGVMAYQVDPRVGWPRDQNISNGMDFIYEYLHSFRMPLFFLVAGFFARFLSFKIGNRAFLKHRFKRILVPFFFSVLLIVPLTSYTFSIYRNLSEQGNLFVNAFLSNLRWTGFYHIWFLYYLMIFYCLQLILQKTFKRVRIKSKYVNELFFFGSTAFLFLIQFFLYSEKVEPHTGIIPQINQICYYGYFFLIGYIIHNNVDFLFRNQYLRYAYLAIGVALIPIINTFEMLYFWKSLLLSLQSNLLILGHIAFFMHLFKKQSPSLRYFSDASYWFYLIHLPIVVGLQLLFFQFDSSPWIKATLVVILTTVFSMITYEWLVRYTAIGAMLNGKKYRAENPR